MKLRKRYQAGLDYRIDDMYKLAGATQLRLRIWMYTELLLDS